MIAQTFELKTPYLRPAAATRFAETELINVAIAGSGAAASSLGPQRLF